jgi:glycosyltransferase involved in cell wall biosynthesis
MTGVGLFILPSSTNCHQTVAKNAQDGRMQLTNATHCVQGSGMNTPRSLDVALVTETYPPEINGVACTVAKLVEGLRGHQHRIQLVRPRQSSNDNVDPGGLLTRGFRIPMYPELRLGLPAKSALVRLWTRRRPDVVHIATEGPLGWSALAAASALHLPVCSEFRTNFHAYSKHYRMAWLEQPVFSVLRRFHNRCGTTMVPTEATRQQLLTQGLENLRVVPRGVDTDRFHPARRNALLRQSWGLTENDLAVIYVGRLAAEKNLGLLVQAFNALRSCQPKAKLVVVGDGPLREDLQAQCPQAVFCGFQSGVELATHYASADVFVFPSLTETFGNVVLEAMASGLCVLAYQEAAAALCIQHGHNGLLAKPGDEAGFNANAFAVGRGSVNFRSLGGRARSTAEFRGWEAVVNEVESVYLGLVNRREAVVTSHSQSVPT